MYIVIEGQDGTGKSTQIKLLADYFKQQHKHVVIVEEPDGDLPQAHDLHDLILCRNYDLEPFSNVLLLTAARVELWHKIIEPALQKRNIVIASRNYWSTLAYQGYGQGVSRNKIMRLTKTFMPERYIKPNHSLILTVPDRVRFKRQAKRGKSAETFEKKSDTFQKRVSAGYLKIAQDFNIPTIDASASIEEIFTKIKTILKI